MERWKVSAVVGFLAGHIVGYCFFCLFSESSHISSIRSTVVSSHTDTVTIVKTDTVADIRPVYISTATTDTVYIDREMGFFVPIERRHYHKEGMYDAWVSGFRPSLDSIIVYARREERLVHRTDVMLKERQRWDIYPYAGFKAFSGTFKPNVGIAIKSPRKWLYGAEIGLYKDNSVYYGVNVGYRIGE